MHDNSASNKDAIDQFLESPFSAAADDELKQRLLQLSTRVLRRRRRLKLFGHAAVLAVCYVAGLATMWLLPAATRPTTDQGVAQRAAEQPPENKSVGATSELSENRQPADSLESDPEVPAAILERIAALSEAKRAVLYRHAGDRYLEANRDTRSALRCYTQSLDAGREQDMAISTEDSWLLIALKKARQEEKRYARIDG